MESFLPAGSTVKKVTVMPSDYGLERLKNEEKFGPALWGQVGAGAAASRASAAAAVEKEEDSEHEEEEEEEGDSEERLGTLKGGDGGTRTKVGLVFAGKLRKGVVPPPNVEDDDDDEDEEAGDDDDDEEEEDDFSDDDEDDDEDEDDEDGIGGSGVLEATVGAVAKGKSVQVAAGWGKTKDFDEEALRRY